MDAPPASLKHIKKYLDEAKARQAQDPLVAYHLRLYALQEAMEVRSKIPKEDMSFILVLMDAAEAEKKTLGAAAEQGDADKQAHVENFALELFEKADDADRAGQSTLATAKVFNSAYHVMESCKQFGELPEDMQEKIKYAKWRVVEIAKATKERRAPAPPRGLEGQAEGGGGEAGGSGQGGGEGVGGGDGGGAGSASGIDRGGGSDGLSLPPPPPGVVPPDGPSAPYPPPPDYLGLPPPGMAPPGVATQDQSSFDSSTLPGAPSTFPPAYPGPPGVPPAVPAGVPPAVPAGASSVGLMPTPPPPGYLAGLPMPPSPTAYTPGKPQMMEAHKLCQSAAAALEFQDHVTAVHSLRQALQLLMMPPAPVP